ncbi:dTDP-4-dehydrorhamnose reductase, partial [bacterium]|nr:dTDP-4-dehydrorhamnose reductase [bacterium]
GVTLPAGSHVECDITDQAEVSKAICEISLDLVIHAAAYTDVDGCETCPDRAYEINAVGSRNVALACQKCGTAGVYMSTDFVFNGKKVQPYIEEDEPQPLSIYGKSKLEGERHFSSLLDKYFIVRSSWLFGQFGKNFVDTILKLAGKGKEKELKVVNDQIGSPTYSKDLAKAIGNLIKTSSYGIFHISNRGSCSWYEFALTILKYAGIQDVTVQPITSDELNRPAKRPEMSILDNAHYIQTVGKALRPWPDALDDYLRGQEKARTTEHAEDDREL